MLIKLITFECLSHFDTQLLDVPTEDGGCAPSVQSVLTIGAFGYSQVTSLGNLSETVILNNHLKDLNLFSTISKDKGIANSPDEHGGVLAKKRRIKRKEGRFLPELTRFCLYDETGIKKQHEVRRFI